jgi:hypothetical protein
MRDGSEERLRETLGWYFASDLGRRHVTAPGGRPRDVWQYLLGLTRPAYNELAARLDLIWHCAETRAGNADTDGSLRVNVTGAENVTALAAAAGVSLCHMSAAGIAGERLLSGERALFTENDFDIGQDLQEDFYLQSKYLGEAAVLNAVRHGLAAPSSAWGAWSACFRRVSAETLSPAPSAASCAPCRRWSDPALAPSGPAGGCQALDVCAEAAVTLRISPMTAYHQMNLRRHAGSAGPSACRSLVFRTTISPPAQRVRGDEHGELLAPLAHVLAPASGQLLPASRFLRRTAAELKRVGFHGIDPRGRPAAAGFCPTTAAPTCEGSCERMNPIYGGHLHIELFAIAPCPSGPSEAPPRTLTRSSSSRSPLLYLVGHRLCCSSSLDPGDNAQ